MELPLLFARFELKRCRVWAWLPIVEFVLWLACPATAQQVRLPGGTALRDRIVLELGTIQTGEQAKLSASNQGRLWAALASDYEADAELSKAEAAYNQALRLLHAAPDGAADYATVLDDLGSLYILMGDSDAAENTCKHSLAVREQLGNQLEIARGRTHLAESNMARHKFKDAQRESSRAYEALVALHDATSIDMATALITLSYANSEQGKGAIALASAEKALTIVRAALPADSQLTGEALMAFGTAKWKAGAKEGAEPEMRAGLDILRAGLPPGHPELIAALEQYRKFLRVIHRGQEAKRVAAEEARLATERSPGCKNCTVSVYGLRDR